MMQVNSKQPILIIGAILAVAIVSALVYTLIHFSGRGGKIPVSINVMPSDASITIDDQAAKSGITYLEPGTYTVKAVREGYEDNIKTVSPEKSEETVVMIMVPVSESAKQQAKSSVDEYNRLQALAEKAAYENGKEFNERNPIARHLPYKTFFYSVGYRADPADPSGNSIIIEIDANEPYRQAAIYRIRQLGYDPTDFTINFRNYENPFPL